MSHNQPAAERHPRNIVKVVNRLIEPPEPSAPRPPEIPGQLGLLEDVTDYLEKLAASTVSVFNPVCNQDPPPTPITTELPEAVTPIGVQIREAVRRLRGIAESFALTIRRAGL